ncbi:hypothetical protein DL89DRAFT_11333 [Linderina pennispora]|uniref:Uncharacterized protein n=1 Tax=Linderina pennispora TaxID=61395 RepID=A0A1Y1WKS3_9FUNG|nr:uncharacterized protein DL89DRAFT_11333 [Linderina pennispora]ORX74181.1 hypothetical protein DL89DRAFT_11333 [Linderina pennispora]
MMHLAMACGPCLGARQWRPRLAWARAPRRTQWVPLSRHRDAWWGRMPRPSCPGRTLGTGTRGHCRQRILLCVRGTAIWAGWRWTGMQQSVMAALDTMRVMCMLDVFFFTECGVYRTKYRCI